MKAQKNRREQFSQGAIADTLPSTDISSSSLLHRHNTGGPPGASGGGFGADGGDAVSLDMEPLMLQSAQDQVYEQNDDYVKSRANAMESIESTIVELGGIFQQLAHLVSEQEEQIKRYGEDICVRVSVCLCVCVCVCVSVCVRIHVILSLSGGSLILSRF